MTLQKYLNDNPNDTFFVGSQVAYFFIGNAETFNKDIEDIDARYRRRFKASLDTSQMKLDNLLEQGEPKAEVVKEYWNNFGVFTRKILTKEEAIKDYYKQVDYYTGIVNKLTDYLANYVHLKNREIKEVHSKDCLNDGISIIVEGIEEGRFWLKEEYETKEIEVSVGRDSKKKVKVN